jgi:hypothetical protein
LQIKEGVHVFHMREHETNWIACTPQRTVKNTTNS